MNGDEYRENIEQLFMAARSFTGLTFNFSKRTFSEMENIVAQADSAGAFVDPTKYRQALADRRLDKQRMLIQACRTFLDNLLEIENIK